tara:strand:+ start:190 stop:486 length:297 start_codon:yes stop_codon:yes gene_type:complete
MNDHLLFVTIVALAFAPKTKPIATTLATWAVAVEGSNITPVRVAIFALLAISAALGQAVFTPFEKIADALPAIIVALLANTWLVYTAAALGILVRVKY